MKQKNGGKVLRITKPLIGGGEKVTKNFLLMVKNFLLLLEPEAKII